MPIVSVKRDVLHQALGNEYTLNEFEKLCFDFGIELDDVTSESEIVSKAKGQEAAKGLCTEVIYKIDIPANRYDLLCLEGLARGLNVFLLKQDPPKFKVIVPQEQDIITLHVKSATSSVRPYVVCAVIRDVSFNSVSLQSFIDLQDKLHTNICRNRTLVAIGTHDLDTIQTPLTYDARKPSDIRFVPLKENREFDALHLFEYYKTKPQCELKKFLPIIEKSPVFPVIVDSQHRVLSLPPIINSQHSKVSLETHNVFIECTANDLTKAKIVINTMCCMFAQYSITPHTVEAVRVLYERDESMHLSPDLSHTQFEASVKRINQGIGINVTPQRICTLLTRMQLEATIVPDDASKVCVSVPPTRSDILHECDILEDVAIAYGFNSIQTTLPLCSTIGREQPLNALSDLIRGGIAEAGFIEVLTWALISHAENFAKLRKTDDGCTAVTVGNPKTLEFEMVRTSLLPGLLKTLGHNKVSVSLPIRLFELSDVSLLDATNDVGARNERRAAVIYCGQSSGFEIVHGLLDRIMTLNNVNFATETRASTVTSLKPAGTYSLHSSTNSSFMNGLSADVSLQLCGRTSPIVIGCLGVLHPDVIGAFSIDAPCSALEICIDWLVV